jgi:hypothetical protein
VGAVSFPVTTHCLATALQISAVLNGAAAYTAFLSFDLSRRTDELGYFQRFVESLCFTVGLNYGLVFLSELFTLASIAVAALLYGANVDVFLAAMKQTAGAREGASAPPGFGALDAVRDAVNAVRVVEVLTNIREMLRAEVGPEAGAAADGDASSRSTFLNLAALLAVMNGSKAMRHPEGTAAFTDNEWHLTGAYLRAHHGHHLSLSHADNCHGARVLSLQKGKRCASPACSPSTTRPSWT